MSKFIKGDDNYKIIDWGKAMQKNPLIAVSIVVTFVIVLATYTNIIGIQAVKSSNNKLINDEVDQKELLFQTILDIENNREIQKIILDSEMRGFMERFLNSSMRFLVFTPQILTKNYLKHAYTIGVILSRTLSESKMHSILKRYQMNNQEIQKEINAVIEKDATLKGEITQLSNSKCDCDNVNTMDWNFPVLCVILYPIFCFIFTLILYLALIFHAVPYFLQILYAVIFNITTTLNCFWWS